MAEVGGMKSRIPTFLLVVVAILIGCREETISASPELATGGGWARAVPFVMEDQEHPTNSAAYLTIENRGRGEDCLIGAETEAATSVEIHETTLVGDVMRMRKLEALDVPPEGSVELEPGGIHLMLLGLTRPLLEGEEIQLTLRFQISGEVTVTVPVRLMGLG
jgi:copper(I)-binding protein